jgi:type III restriction enzyme
MILLYDCVIPRLFNELYEIKADVHTEDYEVELVKEPPDGFLHRDFLRRDGCH